MKKNNQLIDDLNKTIISIKIIIIKEKKVQLQFQSKTIICMNIYHIMKIKEI